MLGHDFTTRTEKAKRAGGPGVPILAIFVVSGCMMVGTDYRRPPAPVAPDWIARDPDSIAPSAEPIGPWWESFGDPVLTDLIVEAYRQNPSLQAAGVRVLEGQARRGIRSEERRVGAGGRWRGRREQLRNKERCPADRSASRSPLDLPA